MGKEVTIKVELLKDVETHKKGDRIAVTRSQLDERKLKENDHWKFIGTFPQPTQTVFTDKVTDRSVKTSDTTTR